MLTSITEELRLLTSCKRDAYITSRGVARPLFFYLNKNKSIITMTNQEAKEFLINNGYAENETKAESIISNINTNPYALDMGISQDLYNSLKG